METYQFEQIFKKLSTLKIGGLTAIKKIKGNELGVSAVTYASGDVLGKFNPVEIEVFTEDNGTGILSSVAIQDLSNVNGAIDVLVFDEKPSNTTFTDDSVLDIHDLDLPKLISKTTITSTDYTSFSDNSIAIVKGINQPLKNNSTTNKKSLWVVLQSRDTKTYVLDELSVVLGFLND